MNVKEVLGEILHVSVKEKMFNGQDKLPLFIQGGYDIELFQIAGIDVLFVHPKEKVTFTALKKHWLKIQELTGKQCVIYGDSCTRYGKERMLELGVPFIYGKDNIYLPFLGIQLCKHRAAEMPNIEKFSPITQKMILMAIYEGWKEISSKEISEALHVSRVTANRILIELQALDLPFVKLVRNKKYFITNLNKRELYEACIPYVDAPVAKTYALREVPDGITCIGGMSALAHYSMIGDNAYPTYAITREEGRQIKIEEYNTLPKTEVPSCIVQILRYKIEKENVIDPISAVLCVPEKDKDDPRVESCMEEVLEEVWNG